MPKEIITLQIGPFANWAGSHFWNVQDDARHPKDVDESGDPLYEDEQADSQILYRSGGRGTQLTPRLILCDAADGFGSLNESAEVNAGTYVAPPAIDPLMWGGAVQEVVQEQRSAHAFVQMMGAPLLGEGGGYADEYAHDEDEDEDEGEDDDERDDDDRSPPRRGSGRLAAWGQPAAGRRHDSGTSAAAAAPPAGEAGEEEEEVRAAEFAFESSVESWSDYLQARLHPRSLGALKPFAHGYSNLARFPDGACLIAKEEDTPGGPELVERCRRFLEECDTLQGIHLLLDADGGYGGAAAALLTQLRDDYTSAPCVDGPRPRLPLSTHTSLRPPLIAPCRALACAGASPSASVRCRGRRGAARRPRPTRRSARRPRPSAPSARTASRRAAMGSARTGARGTLCAPSLSVPRRSPPPGPHRLPPLAQLRARPQRRPLPHGLHRAALQLRPSLRLDCPARGARRATGARGALRLGLAGVRRRHGRRPREPLQLVAARDGASPAPAARRAALPHGRAHRGAPRRRHAAVPRAPGQRLRTRARHGALSAGRHVPRQRRAGRADALERRGPRQRGMARAAPPLPAPAARLESLPAARLLARPLWRR